MKYEIWPLCISGDKTPVLAVLLLSLLHIKSTSPLIQHTIFLFFSSLFLPEPEARLSLPGMQYKVLHTRLRKSCVGLFFGCSTRLQCHLTDWRDAAELHSQSVSINKTSSLHRAEFQCCLSSTPAAAFGIEAFWMWSGVKVNAPKGTISEHEVDGWSRVEMTETFIDVSVIAFCSGGSRACFHLNLPLKFISIRRNTLINIKYLDYLSDRWPSKVGEVPHTAV